MEDHFFAIAISSPDEGGSEARNIRAFDAALTGNSGPKLAATSERWAVALPEMQSNAMAIPAFGQAERLT